MDTPTENNETMAGSATNVPNDKPFSRTTEPSSTISSDTHDNKKKYSVIAHTTEEIIASAYPDTSTQDTHITQSNRFVEMTESQPPSFTPHELTGAPKSKGLSSAFAATPVRVQKKHSGYVFVRPTPLDPNKLAGGMDSAQALLSKPQLETENIDSNARYSGRNEMDVGAHSIKMSGGKVSAAPAFTPVKMHAKTVNTVLKPSLGAMFAKQAKHASGSSGASTTTAISPGDSTMHSNTKTNVNPSTNTHASAYKQPAPKGYRQQHQQTDEQQNELRPASSTK
ncbi:hypothetical protein SARC_15077, partial [Sphaeroforma arctica JP610]